jgi:hypothetical protein
VQLKVQEMLQGNETAKLSRELKYAQRNIKSNTKFLPEKKQKTQRYDKEQNQRLAVISKESMKLIQG